MKKIVMILLATFALGFKEFCDDSESMIDLFSRAELD